jgi:hypothetical protein
MTTMTLTAAPVKISPRFDAADYLLDAIEAVRCGQPGVATDIIDGSHFADVRDLLDALDVPASPYGPGQHARLFRFLCDAAWGRDLPARELPPLEPTDTTTEAETCTTRPSGRCWDSAAGTSRAGTRGALLADAALAALSNAPNSETTHDEPVRDHEARRDRDDGLLLAGSDRCGPGRARPERFDDLPHRPLAPEYAPRDAGATLVRIVDAHQQRDEDPIGLMIDSETIAYLDAFDPA